MRRITPRRQQILQKQQAILSAQPKRNPTQGMAERHLRQPLTRAHGQQRQHTHKIMRTPMTDKPALPLSFLPSISVSARVLPSISCAAAVAKLRITEREAST